MGDKGGKKDERPEKTLFPTDHVIGAAARLTPAFGTGWSSAGPRRRAKMAGDKNLSGLLCDLVGGEPFCPCYAGTSAIWAHRTRA